MLTRERVMELLEEINGQLGEELLPITFGFEPFVYWFRVSEFNWVLKFEPKILARDLGKLAELELKITITINSEIPFSADSKPRFVVRDLDGNLWGSVLLVPGQTLREVPDPAQWIGKMTLEGSEGTQLTVGFKLD